MKTKTKKHTGEILWAIREGTEGKRPLFELTPEQKAGLETAAGAALAIIAAAGTIAIAAAAPNVFQAIHQIRRATGGKSYNFKQKQEKTAQAFYYLKRHGFINITHSEKGLIARLTDKGRRKIRQLDLETLKVKPQKRRNGSWWMVAADIPTKDYRWAADLFRNKIKRMGFCPLQRTLWFYPYDPSKEIEFLSQHFGIAHFVTVMEVSRMDKDDKATLKKFFNL